MSLEQSFRRYRDHGDVAALGAVFDATAQELTLVAAHLAPPGVDAEDLVQACFVAAIEHAPRWDATRPLTPWLIGILVNLVRRERQRTRRTPPAPLLPAALPDPLDVAELQEIGTRVTEALRRLPRHYRQVLTLRLLHGLQPAQIATALGCPVATCKTRLQRGLEQLRRLLPASLSASIAMLVVSGVVSGKGLAICRAAVLSKAATATATATASVLSVGLFTGVVMKKVSVVVALLVLTAAALVTWWPGSGDTARDVGTAPPPATPGSVEQAEVRATVVDAATVRSPATAEPSPAARSIGAPRIRGRVVDPAGAAVGDVSVSLARAIPGSAFADVKTWRMHRSLNPGELHLPGGRSVRTDTEGAFGFDAALLEPGSALFVWHATRGAMVQALPADAMQEVVLVFPDHGQLYGRILDAQGRQVPNVALGLYPAKSGMPVASGRADAEGNYRSVPLPPGSYRITVDSPLHVRSEVEVALDGVDVVCDLPVTLLPVLRAVLVDAHRLAWTGVRLENECGIDAGRFEVLVTQQSCARRADAARGGFEVARLQYDALTGRVTAPIRDGTVAFVSAWCGEARLGEVPLPRLDPDVIELPLVRPAMQVLQVRLSFDPHPAGPVRTVVRLDRPAGYRAAALENEAEVVVEGAEATLAVPATGVPTAWWLSVEAAGYAVSDQPLSWPGDTPMLVHEVQLDRRTRSVHGVLHGSDGTALEAADVLLLGADGIFVGRRPRVWCRTDAQGAFRLDNLPDRALRLLVDADERGMAAVDVPIDATMPLRLVAATPRLFSVRLPEAMGSQLRVLDGLGHTLLDDRLSGTVRYGSPLPIRIAGEPRRIEAFQPGTPVAFAAGEREGDADSFVLQRAAK